MIYLLKSSDILFHIAQAKYHYNTFYIDPFYYPSFRTPFRGFPPQARIPRQYNLHSALNRLQRFLRVGAAVPGHGFSNGRLFIRRCECAGKKDYRYQCRAENYAGFIHSMPLLFLLSKPEQTINPIQHHLQDIVPPVVACVVLAGIGLAFEAI